MNLQEHPGGKTKPENKKTTNNVQASANLVQGNASKVSPINQGFLDGLLPAQWDTFSQGCIGQRFQGSLEDLTLPHFTRSVSPSAWLEKQLQLTLIPQAVNVMTVPGCQNNLGAWNRKPNCSYPLWFSLELTTVVRLFGCVVFEGTHLFVVLKGNYKDTPMPCFGSPINKKRRATV